VYVQDGYRRINKEIDFHTTQNPTSLSALGSILKDFFFWELMSIGVKVVLLVEDDKMGKHLHPYIESGTLKAYTLWLRTHQQGDRLSHHPKFDEPSGVWFHFESFFFFFGNRYQLV
jgi:hypothetical protein